MIERFGRVLLFGASGGIGSALSTALSGNEVVTLSRSRDGLDLTDEASLAAAAACTHGPFDLIFDATGALEIDGAEPEKSLGAIDPAAMAAQFALNAIGPALLLKHFAPKLADDRRAVFATLSARIGSIGDNHLGGWYSYRASKAALNQIVRTAAIEIARRRPLAVVLALHPGTVATALSARHLRGRAVASPAEAASNLLRVIATLGPDDSGGFFAWGREADPLVAPRLILVLGDQLTPTLSSLEAGDRDRDVVVMAEVRDEATYARHHKKKIALIFASMRKFAAGLEADGWRVAYGRYDDASTSRSICGELMRRHSEFAAEGVIATQCGEWRLRQALADCPLRIEMLPDNRFIAPAGYFDAWADGRKTLRMEFFYREMRKRTGLLMDGDKPVGGRWNYDRENRGAATHDLFMPAPMRHRPDDVTEEVLDLVERSFASHPGQLRPFWFATDAAAAKHAAGKFMREALPSFGDYQDAMLTGERFLYHSVLSIYLNIGLLDPLDLCRRAEAEYQAGRAPLNAVEGYIRQILGWREFVRGVYDREGPGYTERNFFEAKRKLPRFYWTGETDMACMDLAIGQTLEEAYAHHIQRLMVTGTFALIAGIDPAEVHEWYLEIYADAYEWVEAPNVIGMSQFADGGHYRLQTLCGLRKLYRQDVGSLRELRL